MKSDEAQPDWIIHKMANPIAQGDLWRALIGGSNPVRRDNLIVIVSADELRRAGAAISRGFSWERTLSELCAELDYNPVFQPLVRFSERLIVNFGCVGTSGSIRANAMHPPLNGPGWFTILRFRKAVGRRPCR